MITTRHANILFFVVVLGCCLPVSADKAIAQSYGQRGGWIVERSAEYEGCIAKQAQHDVIIRYGYDGISRMRFINFSSFSWLGWLPNSAHNLVFDFHSSRHGKHEVLATFRIREGMPTFEIGDLNARFLEILGNASLLSVYNGGIPISNRPISLRKTKDAIDLVDECQD